MMRSTQSNWWAVAVLALAVGLLAIPATAAGPSAVAAASISPAGIHFQPSVQYQKMTLTVSGPEGLILRREFAAGAAIVFDAIGDDGTALPDGAYRYELVAAPVLDRATRRALAAARQSGDDSAVAKLQAEGKLPRTPMVQSGAFRIAGGALVDDSGKEPQGGGTAQSKGLTPTTAADQVIPDDLIVQGSECVGLDCVNNENFGFDTIRLKENNLRIHFDDTSTSAGFPANDWTLIANDSASGGSSKFSIEDRTSAKVPFTITAGAATNSIFADSTGRIGLRTSTPVLDLHIATSNTPAIRLEQNSSGGFTAQTWDIGANEANFFVRDVTGGSKLSFRIRPGAPTSSLDISADGDIGVGTASPETRMDVQCNVASEVCLTVTNSSTTGFSGFVFENESGVDTFNVSVDNNANTSRLNSVGDHPIVILTNSTERIRFPAPGTDFIQATNGAELTAGGIWQDNSSRDSKRDIVELSDSDALKTFQGLNPVTFRYKAEPDEQYVGFIAEDLPDLVATKDRKHMNATDVVAVLTKVVQQQQKTIEDLSARLADLEKEKK